MYPYDAPFLEFETDYVIKNQVPKSMRDWKKICEIIYSDYAVYVIFLGRERNSSVENISLDTLFSRMDYIFAMKWRILKNWPMSY